MKRLTLAALLAALCLAALPPRGVAADEDLHWEEKPRGSAMVPAGEFTPDFILAPTANLDGYLEDCGCPTVKLGGLARRMTYVRELRKAFPDVPMIFVDLGNFARDPRTPDGRIRSRAMLRVFNYMHYTASNAALTEMGDFAFLESLRKEAQFPLVSACWKDAASGEMLFDKPYAEYVLPNGRKIAFLALYQPAAQVEMPLPGGGKAVLIPAAEAAAEWVPRLRATHDAVVLLASMGEEALAELLKRVKGVDFALAAEGKQSDGALRELAGVPVMYLGYEGREAMDIRAAFGKRKGLRLQGFRVPLADWISLDDETEFFIQNTLNELSEETPDDWKRMVEAHKEPGAGQADSHGHQSSRALPAFLPKGYAGAPACAPCHAAAHAAWSGRAHARAMETLQASGNDDNPACVGCHSTGHGDGGFISLRMTPQFGGVQCESCHGPSAGHAADPSRATGKDLQAARYVCFDCHDKHQSPKFEHEKYMALIRHWGEGFPKAAAEEPAAPAPEK